MIEFFRKHKLVFLINILCFMLIGLALADMALTGGIAMDEQWTYAQYLDQTSTLYLVTLLLSFVAFIFNIVSLCLSFKKEASR